LILQNIHIRHKDAGFLFPNGLTESGFLLMMNENGRRSGRERRHIPAMQTITAEEIKQRLAIVDVREDEEVALGIIPGAIHIPLMQIPERLADIPQNGETILVCRTGNRSSRAYDYLSAQGLSGIKNMTGGMLEWEKL
jgi:rhodanese-related sulfurtransferase